MCLLVVFFKKLLAEVAEISNEKISKEEKINTEDD